MEKIAKSSDPVQQHLRDRKKEFNALVSNFISKMIGFKRSINGRGDSRLGLPVSTIKDPLPQEIVSFLSDLSNHYQSIAQLAAQIFQEQEAYSQTRRKPGQQPVGQPGKVATAAAKRGKVIIKDIELPTELAITAEEQERGLMYCTEPKIMSFVYSYPSLNRFWMRNTPLPLKIIFSLKGTITDICDGEPHSTKLIGNGGLSDLIVEMPPHTCEKLGIKIGDPLNLIF